MNQIRYWTFALSIFTLRSQADVVTIPMPPNSMSTLSDCDGSTDTWYKKAYEKKPTEYRITNDETNSCTMIFKNIDITSINRIMINVMSRTNTGWKRNVTFGIRTGTKLRAGGLIPGVDNPLKQSVKKFYAQNNFTFDDVGNFSKVQLEFIAQGYHGSIINIKMYYYRCPSDSKELATYKSTPAPSKKEEVKILNGSCVENARLDSSGEPYLKCYYNNTVEILGRCVCDPGYTRAPAGTSCERCTTDEYKPQAGNQACTKCGTNSKSDADIRRARTKCRCNKDFYRAIGQVENYSADCYESPSKPGNVTTSVSKKLPFHGSYTATLNWMKPVKKGSAELGLYYIVCTNCPANTKYRLNTNTSDSSKQLDQQLGGYAHFAFEITNENNITSLTGSRHTAKINFTTGEGEPGKIRDVKVDAKSSGTVNFSWTAPFAKGGKNPIYVIKYGDQLLKQHAESFQIHSSSQTKTYNVEIFVHVTLADGNTFDGQPYTKTVRVKGGIPLPLYLVVSLSVLLVVVIALVASFCVWKRRNPAYLQVVRMEDGSVKLPTRFYTGGSLYVDPKSYANVNDAINDFAYEIDRGDLTTGDMLGSGEFADVFKGTLSRGGKTHDVAVKMLKPDASKADRDDFLSEAVILGQFNDSNVIRLEGVVYQDEPNAIILEYMVNGSLDKFLQENDMQFSMDELLEMARGIASGLKCLSEMGFVHRDLAARNILVNAEHQCKIADFGMSLEIKIDDSTEEKVGKIPVRWTAPEAIQFKKFTTASDVWSYGVVLWEIMSYGERPYWDWSNLDVLEKVTSGYRLPPPMGCPRVVHDLMLECWKKERAKRPLFSVIRNTIFGWLRNPESLEDIAQSPIDLDPNLDYTIMQTINKWLETIGMGRYTQNFLEQGFATPRQVLLLTMDDIEALGIGPSEHQKKIFKAIEMTRAQVEAQIKTKRNDVKADIIVNPNVR